MGKKVDYVCFEKLVTQITSLCEHSLIFRKHQLGVDETLKYLLLWSQQQHSSAAVVLLRLLTYNKCFQVMFVYQSD